jgi:hypothetical protein
LAPIPKGASTKLADAITAGSHAAFMTGLHTTMLVAGSVALLGAAMGPLLRPKGPPPGEPGRGDEPVANDQHVVTTASTTSTSSGGTM